MPQHSTILVADDNEMVRSLLESLLAPEGHRVIAVENGVRALDVARAETPDLLLLDVMMPEMDGYEVCRRLRADPSVPYIPIIFLSAQMTSFDDLLYGLNLGGDDYLTKPFNALELRARVQSVLRVKRLYNEIDRMKRELERFVPRKTTEMIRRTAAASQEARAELREAAVLFCDIKDFTSFSETHSAEHVFAVLNTILGRLADTVESCGGQVDKFDGDAVMAFFDGDRRVEEAATCARRIVAEVRAMAGLTTPFPLAVAQGIAAGPVMMGNIGSAARLNFTLVGDVVNVAARLCGMAGPFQVLLPAQVAAGLPEGALRFRNLESLRLKGKSRPIEVAELIVD